MPKVVTDAFQAIADPSRRQILAMLSCGSLPINSIAEQFEMSRPAVSKHVKILSTAGFIAIQGKGRQRYCSLEQRGFRELKKWMDFYDQFWQNKVAHLIELLDSDLQKISK